MALEPQQGGEINVTGFEQSLNAFKITGLPMGHWASNFFHWKTEAIVNAVNQNYNCSQ